MVCIWFWCFCRSSSYVVLLVHYLLVSPLIPNLTFFVLRFVFPSSFCDVLFVWFVFCGWLIDSLLGLVPKQYTLFCLLPLDHTIPIRGWQVVVITDYTQWCLNTTWDMKFYRSLPSSFNREVNKSFGIFVNLTCFAYHFSHGLKYGDGILTESQCSRGNFLKMWSRSGKTTLLDFLGWNSVSILETCKYPNVFCAETASMPHLISICLSSYLKEKNKTKQTKNLFPYISNKWQVSYPCILVKRHATNLGVLEGTTVLAPQIQQWGGSSSFKTSIISPSLPLSAVTHT